LIRVSVTWGVTEVYNVANVVGISLGVDQDAKHKSVLDIMEGDRGRIYEFQKCAQCRKVGDIPVEKSDVEGKGGEDDPLTPPSLIKSQVETSEKEEGQWSLVVHKKI
jgi:hypothetical protein